MRSSRLAAALVAGACLVACTSDDDPTSSAATSRTTTPPATSAKTTTPAEPPEPRRLTVAMSGDVLIHTGVWETAERDAAARGRARPVFGPMFAAMEPVVSEADLAICHLETPLSEPAGPYLNYPLFSAPPQVVDGLLQTGYDVCTTSSNHSVDMGFEGLVRTIDTLDRLGMPHTGTYATKADSRRLFTTAVEGVTVGVLSYSYGSNGLPVEKPWSMNLIDVDRMLAQAARMKDGGADVVIAAIHAGTEYTTEPNSQQVEVFDALTASPHVDLVYGHHAHVVQPFAKVNGKWVVYGLGNFVAQQSTDVPDTYRGMTAEFTFVEQPDGSFEALRPAFMPTMITDDDSATGTRVLDAPAALHDRSTDPALRSALQLAVSTVREDVTRPGVRMIKSWR